MYNIFPVADDTWNCQGHIRSAICSYKLILKYRFNKLLTCRSQLTLFYTNTKQTDRVVGWGQRYYLGCKSVIPISSNVSLISITRSIFAFLYVIPSSNPRLTRCWSGLGRSMLDQVICDLWFDGRKHLFEHELSSKEATFPRRKTGCTQQQLPNVKPD
jgi:hypothetical protein